MKIFKNNFLFIFEFFFFELQDLQFEIYFVQKEILKSEEYSKIFFLKKVTKKLFLLNILSETKFQLEHIQTCKVAEETSILFLMEQDFIVKISLPKKFSLIKWLILIYPQRSFNWNTSRLIKYQKRYLFCS